MKLRGLLERGLRKTAAMWPPIERAYRWVHRMAHLLSHPGRRRARTMRRAARGLLGAMTRWLPEAGPLRPALRHFLKVTRSYWPGLFHTYDRPEVPKTNNDLEQLFGSHRFHERRASGRKMATPGMVVRGKVRLIAAVATRLRTRQGPDLAPRDLDAWRRLRRELDERRARRAEGGRFRRKPRAYLRQLERILLKSALPP